MIKLSIQRLLCQIQYKHKEDNNKPKPMYRKAASMVVVHRFSSFGYYALPKFYFEWNPRLRISISMFSLIQMVYKEVGC